ncbi:hypothetical protein AB0F25_29535 [Streptomyces wedmorensis]
MPYLFQGFHGGTQRSMSTTTTTTTVRRLIAKAHDELALTHS